MDETKVEGRRPKACRKSKVEGQRLKPVESRKSKAGAELSDEADLSDESDESDGEDGEDEAKATAEREGR